MNKVLKASKEDCLRELKQSLDSLRTDFIDTWMIKEDVYESGPECIFSKGGALAAAIEAKRKGMVRHIGFAGRRNMQFMLDMVKGYSQFETAEVLFEGLGYGYGAFQERVLPHLLVRNIGIVVADPLSAAQNVGGGIRADKVLYPMWSQLATTITPEIHSPAHPFSRSQIRKAADVEIIRGADHERH